MGQGGGGPWSPREGQPSADPPPVKPRGRRARLNRRPVYGVAALALIALGVLGFVPGMARALFAGQLPPDWIIHVHAAVYWLWLFLFFVQSITPAFGLMRVHRRVGAGLIVYSVPMFVVGCAVTLNRMVKQIHLGRLDLVQAMNLEPAVDMVAFPFLFGAAVYFRRIPAIHKRLMIIMASALIYPAVARIGNPLHFPFFLFYLSPVLIVAGHEYLTQRKIHPIYLGGLVLLAVLSQRLRMLNSVVWIAAIDGLRSLVGT